MLEFLRTRGNPTYHGILAHYFSGGTNCSGFITFYCFKLTTEIQKHLRLDEKTYRIGNGKYFSSFLERWGLVKYWVFNYFATKFHQQLEISGKCLPEPELFPSSAMQLLKVGSLHNTYQEKLSQHFCHL